MPHPARLTTIRRHSIAIGAMIVLSAAGAAAMWTGWLPSRAMQWNDLNGRLAIGAAGAAVTQPEAPPVEHSWIGGAVSTAARANHSASDALPPALGQSAAAEHENQGNRGSAGWNASARAHLVGTAGRSGMGGGGAKGGGGLGAGAGVASASQKSTAAAAPKAPKPAAAKASGSGGRASSGNGGGSVTFIEQTTTVADLAAGTTPAAAAMDLGFTGGAGGAGGSSGPMAPTPEPSSLLLIGTGVVGVAGVLRRRMR